MNRRVQSLEWVLTALLVTMLAVPARAADTVVYYHTDALHSVAVVTNASGAVIERTHYAPYGQVLDRPLRDGPGYTGHQEDAATGLVYMQQRYYDPESGRFLSPDPVQADATDGGNFNRYWYAKDNPYRYTDPDGRNITEFIGGLFVESAHFVTGQGFNGSAVAGALVDGYNGEGGGVLHAALQDAFTASSVAGVAGAVKGAAALVGRLAAKQAIKEGAEIGGKSVAKAAESQGPRFARGKLRQQVMDKGRQADGSIQCKYCGKPTATQSDHVVPYSKGGPTKIENLEPACASCNASKGAKDLGKEWTPPKDRLEH